MASTFQDGGVMVHAQPGAQLFQVVSPSAEASDQVTAAFTIASASAALPSNARVFRFHADQACFITFGTGSATATTADMPFDAGTEVMGVPEPYTHVAAIRNAVDGTLTVTAMA